MKFTISDKFIKKLNKGVKFREWWFACHTAKRMWKRIQKIYKTYYKQTHAISPIEQLRIYPEDFKKLSDETIERGLNLFIKQGGLKSWSKQIVKNADVYLLVFNLENLLQERFSKPKQAILSRVPQEINLNNVELEPIKQSADNVYTKPGEQTIETNDKPTNTKEVDLTLTNPEQEPDADNAEDFETQYAEDEEDYSTPF